MAAWSGEATLRYEIDEQARILQLDLVSAGAADKVLEATVSLIAGRPELCSWDWIVECEPMTDDATVDHLAKLAEAWGPPPEVEAVTVLVTRDRLLYLWARVMDFQFVRRQHLIAHNLDSAHLLVKQRRSRRPAR